MNRPEPEEITMKISDVRAQYHALSNRIYRGEIRVIIEKRGIPVAALVSPEDMRILDMLDERERAQVEYEERQRASSPDESGAGACADDSAGSEAEEPRQE